MRWSPQELTRVGVLNVPDWTEAGKVYAESENAIPFASLLMVQLFLFNFVGEHCGQRAGRALLSKAQGRFGFGISRLLANPAPALPAEIKRWEDIKKPGSQAEAGSFLVSSMGCLAGGLLLASPEVMSCLTWCAGL
jgi:light-harvesting complex I chlorophyll a/b binding protein 5